MAKEAGVVKVVPSGADEEDTLIQIGLLKEREDFLLEDNAVVSKFSGIDSQGDQRAMELDSKWFDPRHLAILRRTG